jgi:hypothetical protein
MKQITYLDCYDYLRQVLRDQTGYDNIRRDDELTGIPRLGLDKSSLRNVRLAILRRFKDLNLDPSVFTIGLVAKCESPEELLDTTWDALPQANKI